MHPLEEFAKVFGVGSSANGWTYSFWSGFGSCLAYFGAIGMAWRHLNCHAKGCWRLGRHPIAGGKYKVCHRHHPDITSRSMPVDELHAMHADHLAAQATPSTPRRAPETLAAHPEPPTSRP